MQGLYQLRKLAVFEDDGLHAGERAKLAGIFEPVFQIFFGPGGILARLFSAARIVGGEQAGEVGSRFAVAEPSFFYGKGAMAATAALGKDAFLLSNSEPLTYSIHYSRNAKVHSLHFRSLNGGTGSVRVKGEDIDEMVKRLADTVFSSDLKGRR